MSAALGMNGSVAVVAARVAVFSSRSCVALALVAGCTDSPVEPRAAPDTIIYWSYARGTSDIVALGPGESTPRRLTITGSASEPEWSWDGRWIVYLDQVPTGVAGQKALQVFRMRADGTGKAQITTDTGNVEAPTISPDGRRVAYECGNLQQREPYRICIGPPEGSTRVVITPTVGGNVPVWSPDGSLIAFACDEPSVPFARLCTVAPDGTGLRAISPDSLTVQSMAWSPDGSQFAVAARIRNAVTATLYIMSTDGRQVRRVFDERQPVVYRDSPTWSPDGTRLAFVRYGAQGAKVYVANIDGTGERPLFDDATEQWDPSWSPRKGQ